MKRRLRLLRFVAPHWPALVVLLITTLIGIGLELLTPWPMKILVDQVLQGHSVPAFLRAALRWLPGNDGRETLLVWVCVSTVVLFVLTTAATAAGTLTSVLLGQRVTYDLGAALFMHLQRLSLLYHTRRPVGDSIARVTGDAYCAYSMLNDAIVPLLRSVLTLGAMFAVMWRLQPRLTLVSLGVTPFLVASMKLFGEPMRRRYRRTRDLEGEIYSTVEQTLNAIPAVQANVREEIESQRFRAVARENVRAEVGATLSSTWFELVVGLITTVGLAAMLYLAAHYVLRGAITVGTVLVFVAYLRTMYGPLNSITYTASAWQHAAADADRVLEILETAPDVQDSPGAVPIQLRGFVRFEDVAFAHEPGRFTLRDVSLDASPGEVVAIAGPTGAGKTTLVNLIVRFFDPAAGRVTIDGHDLRELQVQSLRRQVAIVLQDAFIFPMTIADNISYGRPDALRDEIVAAAKAAGADEFVRRLPEGYDTVVGERGATLSGGERQRLSIARAFLKNAPILILDEPTSALDARTESLLLDALERLMEGRTTFMIAHRLSTIRHAHKILVLEGGRIVELGTHEELVARHGLYARMHQLQTGTRAAL